MDVLTYPELMTALLSVLGAGLLLMLASSREPKALHDEIALSVERSIELLDTCKDSRKH
jgi:hypothetical protein